MAKEENEMTYIQKLFLSGLLTFLGIMLVAHSIKVLSRSLKGEGIAAWVERISFVICAAFGLWLVLAFIWGW